jgi:hypothetical protein
LIQIARLPVVNRRPRQRSQIARLCGVHFRRLLIGNCVQLVKRIC